MLALLSPRVLGAGIGKYTCRVFGWRNLMVDRAFMSGAEISVFIKRKISGDKGDRVRFRPPKI